MNTNEMIGCFRKIRDCSDGMEEALDTLVTSKNFDRMALFVTADWEQIYFVLEEKNDADRVTKENWREMLAPAIFLAVREMPDDLWGEALLHDLETEPEYRMESHLYRYLRNRIREEIQRDLFDGSTFYEYTTHEEEWPADPDEPDEPWLDAFYYDGPSVEEEVETKLFLDKIKALVTEREWDIITADHGDGPMLAEKYETSESNIRNIRQRTLERLQEVFCDELKF